MNFISRYQGGYTNSTTQIMTYEFYTATTFRTQTHLSISTPYFTYLPPVAINNLSKFSVSPSLNDTVFNTESTDTA